MTSAGRPRATADGQHRHSALADPALRSRVLSGIRSRANSPLSYARQLLALHELIASIGPPCWASGRTAAALHRFDGYELHAPFHVVVPRGRSVNRIGHVIHTHRAMNALDTAVVDGAAATSATRTIIDLAASEPADRLTACVDSATRDGSTSDEFLHRRLVELRVHGRGGIGKLLGVLGGIEVQRGGHSWLEREFLRLVHQAGLPRPDMQQVLARRGDRLIRVDCRFAGTPVVVELLGYTFHRTMLQMQSDTERMNRLILAGFLPYQFTYLDVTCAAGPTMATLGEALRGVRLGAGVRT